MDKFTLYSLVDFTIADKELSSVVKHYDRKKEIGHRVMLNGDALLSVEEQILFDEFVAELFLYLRRQ